MHVISVQGSNTQKSKLRNGHKVRVKHGAGFNVIVSPNTYHIVSRAFMKNKGISLQLSPDELAMNRAPSPEMQQAIMGHTQHMVIPGVTDHINVGGRGLGTGIGDFFKNIGNKIQGAFQTVKEKVYDPVYKPIEKAIVNPIKEQYEKYVPEEYRRDIDTATKFMSPTSLALDLGKRTAKGEKPMDIMKDYFERAKHLNATKNKIIKSSPALTEAYKKGVMTTAGLGSAALGSAFGLSPATGALAGLAASKGAEQLLKAEGYGLHHAIDVGIKHAYHKLKKHFSPIEGGAIGKGHISDFFKHAGKTVKSIANFGGRQAQKVNDFVLNNPELGKKIVEHGSKLAGLLAKEGVKYLTGDEALGDLAGNVGTELGQSGLKKAGYGEEKPKPVAKSPVITPKPILESQYPPMPYHYDKPKTVPAKSIPAYTPTVPQENLPLQQILTPLEIYKQEMKAKRKAERGRGLYASRQMRGGMLEQQKQNLMANAMAQGGVSTSQWEDQKRRMGRGGAIKGFPIRMPSANTNYANSKGLPQGGGIEPPSRLVGGGFNSYDSLHNAAMGYTHALERLASMQDKTVYGQHHTDPIKRYWDEIGQPPSRGTGIHKSHHGKVHHKRTSGFEGNNPYNLVRGRGSLIEHSHLPPALQSQPYGSNFHMQFMLPPQYQKYNDGTNEY